MRKPNEVLAQLTTNKYIYWGIKKDTLITGLIDQESRIISVDVGGGIVYIHPDDYILVRPEREPQ